MSDAASVLTAPRSRLILERVLGLTALSNAMVAVNPVSGELAYAAGCIVVVYNLRRNKQVRYYRVDKSVACLCFSSNGQFLAIGEKGYLPAITIWDGTDGTLCAELQRHQYGVACMAFSQDGRFLLSAGLVHDQHLYAWELKLKRKDDARRLEVAAVGCARVEDKILDADFCQAGNFFVTVGEKHFKYWFLDDNGSFLVTGLRVNELPELQHRDAVVNAKTSATFTGVGCGYGSCELKTFAVTSDGTLCCFGASGIMERLVSLESSRGNAISVTESYVAVGGSSGVVRLFNPSTLEYRATLPFPPAFGAANKPPNLSPSLPAILYPADPFRYPAVIGTRLSGSHVIVFYSDRSIFIYSTANPDAVTVERSFLYHSGGIRDMQVAGSVRGINPKGKLVYRGIASSCEVSADTIPTGTFVTCSDDNTVRLWNLELNRRPVKPNRFSPGGGRTEHEFWKNPYSQEMLRVVYNDHEHDFEVEHCAVLGGTCSHESSNSVHSPSKGLGLNKSFQAVAIRPDQREIASGDQEGNVIVIPVPFEKSVIRIGAHSSKVNCLAYSSMNDDGNIFMVSGGKDRLIQLYDCQRGHVVLKTLENHSAAVTTVSLSRDGKTLLSSGADNSVSVSGIDTKGDVVESKTLPFSEGKIFDTVLLPDCDAVVASCNNTLEVFSTIDGKQQQMHLVGEQHHIAVCPANYCAALSGSFAERIIRVVDIITGETLATGTGHGEAITALKFTPDCRRLLSASSDGCVFVWRLADDIQAEIKARLPRVLDVQGPIPAIPREIHNEDKASVMPPPAPPISGRINQKNTSSVADSSSWADAKQAQFSSEASGAIEEERTASNRVPKRFPSKWKGKAVAVPGPMAGIPMENWMRTRASAKPTIHVIEELKTTVKAPHNNGTLAIDRLQTPEWARTAQSGPDSLQSIEAVGDQASGHGKWGYQIAASLPTSDKDLTVNDLESSKASFPESDTRGDQNAAVSSQNVSPGTSSTQSSKTSLMNLSVEVDSNPLSSSSLALEREQLEKRKRQIDTANAVAAMNTRLSQLGLLKTQKTTPPAGSTQASPSPAKRRKSSQSQDIDDFNNEVELPSPTATKAIGNSTPKSFIPIPKKVVKETNASIIVQRPDNPDEVTELFEVVPAPVKNEDATQPPGQERLVNVVDNRGTGKPGSCMSEENSPKSLPAEMADDSSSDGDPDKFTEDLVNQALNALNSQEPAMPPPVDDQVGGSLSTYTLGYVPQTQAKPDAGQSVEIKNQHNRSQLDASLSTFMSGFATSKEEGEVSQHSVNVQESVASSLSAFTTGYGGDKKFSDSQAGVQSSFAIDESMSTFTMGYSAGAVSPAQVHLEIPVDESLSNFTSGYEAEKPQAGSSRTGVQPIIDPTKASLSTFTSGCYGAEVSPMSTKNATDSKCVDVQAPNRLSDVDNDPSSSQSKEGTPDAVALKAISGLCQPLEDAATALNELLNDTSDMDSKLHEIQELIKTLRSAITCKLK